MLNVSVFLNYRWAIVFYGVIIILILLNKKRFDMHGILALYRTRVGIGLMERISKKYREVVKLMGYIGIGIGFLGLAYILITLLKALYDMIAVPNAPASIAPVIPGVPIPGSPIQIPLISGWIVLFIVILVHEFSHGVVLRAHEQKVKSSGVFFLGPLMGAFVEPEEEKLKKQSDVVQYSVAAAGPFANVLLGFFVLLIAVVLLSPLAGVLTEQRGFSFESTEPGKPADLAGLNPGMIITEINNKTVKSLTDFSNEFRFVKPGEEVTVTANGTKYTVITVEHPQKKDMAYLGILNLKNEVGPKKETMLYKISYPALSWLFEFFELLFILSLGIGLINLWPIFITDGARMLQVAFLKIVKDKKRAFRIWKNVNMVALLILFLLLLPILKNILSGLVSVLS